LVRVDPERTQTIRTIEGDGSDVAAICQNSEIGERPEREKTIEANLATQSTNGPFSY
jgi:hypothetical protein